MILWKFIDVQGCLQWVGSENLFKAIIMTFSPHHLKLYQCTFISVLCQCHPQTIKGIMEEVMKGLTMSTTESLKCEIERIQEDLEFKLEKTALPRPQALGKKLYVVSLKKTMLKY